MATKYLITAFLVFLFSVTISAQKGLSGLLIDIETRCQPLTVSSETESDVHAFVAPLPVIQLTPELFLESILRDHNTPIEVADFHDWIDSQVTKQNVEQWDNLRFFMIGRLTELVVYRVGTVNVDTYVVGLFNGRVVGIRTFEMRT